MAGQIERRALVAFRDGLFFAAVFIYTWLEIDPRLLHHCLLSQWVCPTFSLAPGFLGRFINHPGGPAEYLTALLLQSYYLAALGAGVITLQIALVCLLTRAYFKALTGAAESVLSYLIAMALVAVYNDYDHLAPTVYFLAALAGTTLYVKAAPRNLLLRTAVLLLVMAAVWYVASGMIVLCASLCVVYDISRKGRRAQAIAGVVAVAAVAALYAFGAGRWPGLAAERREWFDFEWALWWVLWRCVVLFFPVAAVVAAFREQIGRGVRKFLGLLWPRLAEAMAQRPSRHDAGPKPQKKPWERRFEWVVKTAFLMMAVGAVFLGASHKYGQQRRAVQIDYFATRGQWRNVLAAAEALPEGEYTYLVAHDVNMALARTGRLGDDMFKYPQKFPMLLEYKNVALWAHMYKLADTFLALGRINDAEHCAHEALVMFGPQPEILQFLAFIKMVKSQPDQARVFLNALSYDLVHGGWASDRLRELADDPSLSSDAGVQEARARMLRWDDVAEVFPYRVSVTETAGGRQETVSTVTSYETVLRDVIRPEEGAPQTQPGEPSTKPAAPATRTGGSPKPVVNRLAFEYLMAMHLLYWAPMDPRNPASALLRMEGLERFINNIRLWDAVGYREIPRHYEEAILVYEDETGVGVDLGKRQISPGTMARFEKYKEMVYRHRGNPAAAFQEMAASMADTFFFYWTYGPGVYK
ncbi:MAG: DUF6057 family protein [Phycisphaerae bacterium]